MGYPVSLRGDACGLIIMYLLGIFNHNPLDYKNAIISSNIALLGMILKNKTRFDIRIAEPVRAKIQQRLNKYFNCEKTYCMNKAVSTVDNFIKLKNMFVKKKYLKKRLKAVLL